MAGLSIAKQSYRILSNVIVCSLAYSLLRGLDKTWLFVTIGMCQFGSNKEHYFCSSLYNPAAIYHSSFNMSISHPLTNTSRTDSVGNG